MHGFKYDAIIVYNFIDEFYTIRIENNIEHSAHHLQSKHHAQRAPIVPVREHIGEKWL